MILNLVSSREFVLPRRYFYFLNVKNEPTARFNKIMIWLLMVVHLNLSTTPIQVQYGEVLEVFHSERECVIKHDEFFNKAQWVV